MLDAETACRSWVAGGCLFDPIQFVDSGSISPRNEVPDPVSDVRQRLAVLYQQACIGVAEIMKWDTAEAQLLQQAIPHAVSKVAGSRRSSSGADEHPVRDLSQAMLQRLFPPQGAQGSERLCELPAHINVPPLAALGCRQVAGCIVLRVVHFDKTPVEVDILPP